MTTGRRGDILGKRMNAGVCGPPVDRDNAAEPSRAALILLVASLAPGPTLALRCCIGWGGTTYVHEETRARRECDEIGGAAERRVQVPLYRASSHLCGQGPEPGREQDGFVDHRRGPDHQRKRQLQRRDSGRWR